MAYRIDSGIWSSVFAVPAQVVDQHIKLCGPLSLKVLLVLLRHGGELEAGELAQILNQPVADVQDAMNYWMGVGLLAQPDGSDAPQAQAAVVSYQQVPDPEPPPQPAPQNDGNVTRLTRTRQRLSTQEINELAAGDQTVMHLLQEAQGCLGKTLSPLATDTIVALYSYYGMQPDLVLMLLQYCVSLGKDSPRYVEKVAASWLEQGIDTHEKAEREILRRTQEQKAEYQIQKAFGIGDRSLVPSERKYIKTWLEEYRADLPLVQLAYERSVELKGKLSFAYINGILTNWHKSGITTPAQAVQEMQQNRQQKTAEQQQKRSSSYDLEDLEQLITYGDIL